MNYESLPIPLLTFLFSCCSFHFQPLLSLRPPFPVSLHHPQAITLVLQRLGPSAPLMKHLPKISTAAALVLAGKAECQDEDEDEDADEVWDGAEAPYLCEYFHHAQPKPSFS